MEANLMSIKLNKPQFEKIRKLLYQLCGINLTHGKEELVKARLMKRLRVLGLKNFDQYIKYIETGNSGEEVSNMIDVLTTNKTDFFRESGHFDYLSRHILPGLRNQKKIRIWSAGCSSGEEPFTIAIRLREDLPNIDKLDIRILATDISTDMLKKVREAVYQPETLRDVPAALVKKYFTRAGVKASDAYRVNDNLRKMLRIARLNLMGPWPMKGPFDMIFCRNVMIYFDKPTQQKLINRYWKQLRLAGHLFVGHSESMAGITHKFRYVQPAVYVK